ncbi:MAG: radical SAM protein [bacterium]
MKIIERQEDSNNTLFVVETEDRHTIEAVLYRGTTLCVSTQVGCAIRCKFCASGRRGLIRNLSLNEMWDQVNLVQEEGFTVARVSLAGIGEPLHNFDVVREFIAELWRGGIKPTITTTGANLKNLSELLRLHTNGLTVSLHSGSNETRRRIMDLNNLDEMIDVLEEGTRCFSRARLKRLQLGYLILRGVNDGDEEIERIAQLSKRLRARVYMMYYNPVDGSPFEPPTNEEYEAIFRKFAAQGIRPNLSTRFRVSGVGGCGTLVVDRLKGETERQGTQSNPSIIWSA